MRIIRTGIISAAMCAAFSFYAWAAQGTISFSDPQVTVGDEVNVSMKITADAGTSLESANVVLTYPSGLEFVSGTDADGGAGAVRVHGTTNGGGTSSLEYNLKFKTSAAGNFGIGIDSYEVYDADDQPIEFTHLGSSNVTVSAASGTSADTTLTTLEVYPGTLEPAFSADVAEYNLTVGLGVSDITVNAIGADSEAKVSIDKSYEGELPEGSSDIVVKITAADGTTAKQYTIHVEKVEGGAETSGETQLNVEGVKLSSKGKTIIVMNPPADATVPEGLKEGTITIDGQKVQGWVWGASEEPEYCVVYGMTADSSKSGDAGNSYGNMGFYRYDMTEKTIQRYFEDPLAAGSVSSAEYAAAQDELAKASRSAETRLIIMVALAVIAFAAVMAAVYMSVKYKANEKVQRAYRRRSFERFNSKDSDALDKKAEVSDSDKSVLEAADKAADISDVNELLKHDYDAVQSVETEESAADETQVIRRPERRRRPRRVVKAEHITDEEDIPAGLGDDTIEKADEKADEKTDGTAYSSDNSTENEL